MAALNAFLATPAVADMDVELALDGPARNFDLKLLIDVSFVDGSATIGTRLRQRRLVDFVDLLRRRPVRLGAVVLAGVTARLFGIRLGRLFGEGSGLPFAGSLQLLDQSAQPTDLGFMLVEALFQRRNDLVALATSWTADRIHAVSLAKRPSFSCASWLKCCRKALNSYTLDTPFLLNGFLYQAPAKMQMVATTSTDASQIMVVRFVAVSCVMSSLRAGRGAGYVVKSSFTMNSLPFFFQSTTRVPGGNSILNSRGSNFELIE